MRSDVQKFINYLDEAIQLLDSNSSRQSPVTDPGPQITATGQIDPSFIEQWSELCVPKFLEMPPIRIVHHLSCTGGTLISKCLAAMPNVSVFSEVNPLSLMDDVHRSGFAPTDLTYLAKQINFPMIDDLSINIFKAGVGVLADHARQLGKHLVLREHSHSNFHYNEISEKRTNIRTILECEHSLLPIVTVRHPIDSYLSLMSSGWIKFTPATFAEYCRRYLLFLEDNEGLQVFKYEEFVDDTQRQMRKICQALDLPFDEDFVGVFDLYHLSGDSGRASNIIEKRSRRKYDESFYVEAKKSTAYAQLCEQLNYNPSLAHPGSMDYPN